MGRVRPGQRRRVRSRSESGLNARRPAQGRQPEVSPPGRNEGQARGRNVRPVRNDHRCQDPDQGSQPRGQSPHSCLAPGQHQGGGQSRCGVQDQHQRPRGCGVQAEKWAGWRVARAPSGALLPAVSNKSERTLLLSVGSYVPAPPPQPSCGRQRTGGLASALRFFPPTSHPLLALRVAPAPSDTATRCSARRQKTWWGRGKPVLQAPAPAKRSITT